MSCAGAGPAARAARGAGLSGGAAAGGAAGRRRERRAARGRAPLPRLRPAPPHLRRRHAAPRPPHTPHGRHHPALTRTRFFICAAVTLLHESNRNIQKPTSKRTVASLL